MLKSKSKSKKMKVFVPKSAVKKINLVFKQLEKIPGRFNMDFWGASVKDMKDLKTTQPNNQHGYDLAWLIQAKQQLESKHPPCGTVACLAGQILVTAKLIKPKFTTKENWFYVFPNNTPNKAAKYLGIKYSVAKKLFFPYVWPSKFRNQLEDKAPGTKAYLNVAKRRFEHLVKTGE